MNDFKLGPHLHGRGFETSWINPSDWMGNVIRLTGDYEYAASDPNIVR